MNILNEKILVGGGEHQWNTWQDPSNQIENSIVRFFFISNESVPFIFINI